MYFIKIKKVILLSHFFIEARIMQKVNYRRQNQNIEIRNN